MVYGVLQYDLRDDTSFIIGGHYQYEHKNHFWYDIPTSSDGGHLNLPRKTKLSNDWEYNNTKTTTVFSTLTHKLNENLDLKLITLQSWVNTDLLGTATYRHEANSPDFWQQVWGPSSKDRSHNHEASIAGLYDIFGHVTRFTSGIISQKQNTRQNDFDYSFSTIENIDIFNRNRAKIEKPHKVGDFISNTTIDKKSTYLATQIEITQAWKFLLGGRADWYDYKRDNLNSNERYKINRRLTKYIGTTYDIDSNHTFYTSYSDIFSPQSEVGLDHKIIKPIVGETYEAGLKGEYFDGLLNTSISLYRVNQTNRAKQIPGATGCVTSGQTDCYEASGLVRTNGFDLEVQGAITPRWEVGAGYTHAVTKYVKDGDAENIGKRFSTGDSPVNLFKLTSLYKFDGDLSSWRVGVNSYWQSSIYEMIDDSTNKNKVKNEQKTYNITDLIIGYHPAAQWDVQLIITNIFDKKYYSSIGNSVTYGTESYGEPRGAYLSATYKF